VKGSQNKKIKAVMNGGFSNMIEADNKNRMSGVIAGGIVGLIAGGIFKSNPIYTAIVGMIIGFVTTKK
jgi:hypothetical protein